MSTTKVGPEGVPFAGRHPIIILILAPLAGAAFCVFLPFIGIVLTLATLAKWANRRVHAYVAKCAIGYKGYT